MTLAPRVPPNAKVIGEPGTVGRALACGANYLITCFSHSGWIASNNFHFKRHSRVSNRLPMGPFVDVPPQTGGNDSAAMQLKHYLQLKRTAPTKYLSPLLARGRIPIGLALV